MPSELYSELRPFFASIGRRRLTLALSGGIDSSVLLHLLARARTEYGFSLSAVHVHHGLSPYADQWAEFCTAACTQQQVALTVRHVRIQADGSGTEAAARAARYRVFAELDTDILVLAHHADDQRETFLLSALRGGGIRALAAMPLQRRYGSMEILRPLLHLPRSRIAAYAQAFHIDSVEDDSNSDTRFLRNWIRHQLMPFAQAHLPHLPQQLDAAVWQAQEDLALLEEFTAADRHWVGEAGFFDCLRWQTLSAPRRRRLLSDFARQAGLGTPRRQSVENFNSVLTAKPQAAARWDLPRGTVYASGGRLFALAEGWQSDLRWHVAEGLSGCLKTAAAACGIRFTPAAHGLPPDMLLQDGLIRCPAPHDVLAIGGGHHKPVKKLLQEHGVPAFIRPYWPLIVSPQNVCLAITGIRVAAGYAVSGGLLPTAPTLTPYLIRSGRSDSDKNSYHAANGNPPPFFRQPEIPKFP